MPHGFNAFSRLKVCLYFICCILHSNYILARQERADVVAQAAAAAAAAKASTAKAPLKEKIPKPAGPADGGQGGFHLRKEMGLNGGRADRLQYNAMLVCVRTLAPSLLDHGSARLLYVNWFMQLVLMDLKASARYPQQIFSRCSHW